MLNPAFSRYPEFPVRRTFFRSCYCSVLITLLKEVFSFMLFVFMNTFRFLSL